MSFRITILGSSGAVPAYGRHPSSQLIEVSNQHLLFDCGEGTQIRLTEAHANIHRINAIFITHLHGDHYLGLAGLLFTMHLHHRENELHIFSHKGLDEVIINQLRYSRSVFSFELHMHFLNEGVQEIIYEDKLFTVEALPMRHKVPCSGFLIRERPKLRKLNKSRLAPSLTHAQLAALQRGDDLKDNEGKIIHTNESLTLPAKLSRSYAYCTDTQYDESLVNRINKVDLLYHEATFTNEHSDKAEQTMHSTAMQAARIAKAAGVQRLLLGHFSARYKDTDLLLSQARQIFENTYLVHDLDVFEIEE